MHTKVFLTLNHLLDHYASRYRMFLNLLLMRFTKGLLFQPPQPHEGWKEPLEAFEFGNLCPQKLMFGANTIVVNEDCLYLNIFTPGR